MSTYVAFFQRSTCNLSTCRGYEFILYTIMYYYYYLYFNKREIVEIVSREIVIVVRMHPLWIYFAIICIVENLCDIFLIWHM